MPTCMCASTQPGKASRPLPSTTWRASCAGISRSMRAKRPSLMPTSMAATPSAFGRTTRRFLTTRSSMLWHLPETTVQISPVPLGPDDRTVMHHGHAAHDRPHRPPLELPPVVEAVVGVRLERLPLDLSHLAEVHQREVGVGADRDAALARLEVEDARWRLREHRADALEREPTLVIALRKQNRQDRCDAGETLRRLPERLVLARALARRVIGPDDLDRAVGESFPHRRHVVR